MTDKGGLSAVDIGDPNEPEETRGQAIERRRLELGFRSAKAFADAIGGSPNRETIGKAEKDDPTVKEPTYRQLEVALSQMEQARASAPQVLRARITGRGGFEVTFESPIDAPHELAAVVADALKDLTSPPETSDE
jgi:hypothetical protein